MIVIATLCLGLCLTACGNNSQSKEHASLEAENSSLKANSRKANSNRQQTKISNDEYALMAYLKLQGQSVQELKDNMDNMNWNQDGNTYRIDFGAHTTSMTVTEDNVEVTYDDVQGDHMGQGNGHKTYSKQQLAKEFGNQKSVIEEILSSASQGQSGDSQTNSDNNGPSSNGQQTKANSSSSPIKSSQDAANLVEHSMHSEPGTYQATPTGDGGYAIHGGGQDGQVGYVHSDGSVTWSNGETQSYGELSAPTTD